MFELIDAEVVDKGVYGINVVSGGDSDDLDLISVLFIDRRDRAGLTATTASPRGPEPENGVGAFERAGVDLASTNSG